MRKTLRVLTTRRLDGRSALAVAVRRWKEDVRRDLGGDLTRAQETILEAAAQAWVILASQLAPSPKAAPSQAERPGRHRGGRRTGSEGLRLVRSR